MKDLRPNGDAHACVVCFSENLEPVVSIPHVPIHCNRLAETAEEARAAPRGPIRLVFCRDCGHVFNAAFDGRHMDYSTGYETSQHFSGAFRDYARTLAGRLIERYALVGKDVIEIGCGQGEFLELLCSLGGNRGIGFDPCIAEGPDRGIEIVHDDFSGKYAHYEADLICCRHVLEHLPYPGTFLESLRRTVGERERTAVFFEVPNVLATLKEMAVWDVIYEHCSYFCKNSLRRVFVDSGFAVRHLEEAFGGQFLCVEASPHCGSNDRGEFDGSDLEEVAMRASVFPARYREKVAAWRARLDHLAEARKRVVVWGAGSKGATFLNTVEVESEVACIVDANPRKQGRFIPGTGHRIVCPEELSVHRPDMVIAMNPIYVAEIERSLAGLELTAQVIPA